MGLPSATFAEVTVEDDKHLDFSDLDVENHAGILLDGVSDVMLLKRCCDEVNKECDVEGLCKGLPKRMKLLQEKDGDRLKK